MRLIQLLLAACIVTGVQAHVLQCHGLLCPRKCLVGIKNDGQLQEHDVQSMLGIDLTSCSDPTALANVQNFSLQIICQGLGYQPEAGVAVGNELVTVRDLNNMFRCSEPSLHFEANNLQQVVDFYNDVLEVATCKQVGGMYICGLGSKKEVGWATVQLHVCTSEGKQIHVFRPYATLHGVRVDLKENTSLSEIPDLLKPFDYHNAIVLVPKALLPTVVDLFKWSSAKDAASKQDDLSNLRELWRNLCSNDKSQQDVFSCDEITNQMVALCEEYRSDDDKHKVQKLQTCVKKIYPEDTTKQAHVMQNEIRKICEVLRVPWTTPTELYSCMQKKDKAVWDQCVELMITVRDKVFSFVQISLDAISYVNSWVDCIFGYSWKAILFTWHWKKTLICCSFSSVMLTLYTFSRKLEEAGSGSKSIGNRILLYFLGFVLSPIDFAHDVKKNSEELIESKVTENSEARKRMFTTEFQRQMSESNTSTKNELLSVIDEKVLNLQKMHALGVGEVKSAMAEIENAALKAVQEEFAALEQQTRPVEKNKELMWKLTHKKDSRY